MKFSIKHILSTVALSLIGLVANSQAPNSLYFLNNPQSHYLNPALTTDKGWVTLPLGGYFTINSDLGLGSFMTPYGDDKMRLFTHPEISVKDAMSKFKDINSLEFETATNLLTVGFNAWGGTNSIGLSMKMHGGFYIPKDIFRFLKEGQEADGDTEYKLDKFGGRMQAYSEIALGHARDINKKLTIGAKVKLILGLAYANANIDNMRIHMTDKEWNIEHNTSIVTSQALDIRTNNDGEIDDVEFKAKVGGFGLGLDLGATYKIMDNLNVSLAITDIGFINWDNASVICNRGKSFSYKGFDNIAAEDSQDFEDAAEEIGDDLKELIKFDRDQSATSKTTSLYTTFRAGAEYGVLKNKITFGLLVSSRVGAPKNYTEGMLTVNFKPVKSFGAAINGSVSNVRSSVGATITLGNFFIGADYILTKFSKQFIPVDASKFSFASGVSFRFGSSRKKNFEAKDI